MTESSDDVSQIHKRYYLTLFSPTSYFHSLIVSVIIVGILVTTATFGYLKADDIAFRLPVVIAVLLITQLIDSRLIKKKEYSKSLHMSLFGNIIWLASALAGLLASLILAKDANMAYLTIGMFLFASFRIGIFTTTLGIKLGRAWAICFIQPLSMFLVLIPYDLWRMAFSNFVALTFGIIFLAMGTVWSILTDRSGRPTVKSAHELVQAYIASMGGKDYSEMETLMESKSSSHKVLTSQLRLFSKDNELDFRLVLPEIHPGPYHPIGGSNIPYLIYKNLASSAMVMHSISDHTLNLPSKSEVENYLQSLNSNLVQKNGFRCTEPVIVQVNKARAVGLLFEKNALLMLSLSPHGMEDLPSYIKSEIEQYAKNRMFEKVLCVDCHNAMGKEISKENAEDLLTAAKSCLDALITKESFPIEAGYANSNEIYIDTPDLGPAGIGVLCLKINDKKFFFGWADANNMENGVREKIVEHFAKNDLNLVEICTSDTHFSHSKVRNKQGYYQFGSISKVEDITKWFYEITQKAEKNTNAAEFEIIENESSVKVMGPKIFEDYLKALDNSLRLTKGFLISGLVIFLISLIL